MTAQLVQAGNQQATSFRPAFELALEGVIDTDTFKSIFRNAVRQTHEAIIEQGDGGGRQGLDLGRLVRADHEQSPGRRGRRNQQGASGLDNSLSDVTSKIDDLGLWDAEGIVGQISAAALVIGLAAAVGSILLAEDRRRAVRRLGIAAVIGGLFIVALLFVATWLIGRQIEDAQLADAIKGALGEVTDDLRLTGLWIAAYGLVVAAAAASTERRYTPAEVWNRARGWIGRRRQTTWGTILLGVLGIVISIVFIQEPLGQLRATDPGGRAVGRLPRRHRDPPASCARSPRSRRRSRALWPRLATVGAAIVVIAGMVTVGFLVTTRGAANAAQASDGTGLQRQEVTVRSPDRPGDVPRRRTTRSRPRNTRASCSRSRSGPSRTS